MTIREIERAAAGLRDVIHSIPVSSSKTFSDMSGAELYMKCENLQKTGSFKVRGAYNKIARLAGEGVREVVASSAGNHAQGVAFASTSLGVQSTIVMPRSAPLAKAAATEGYGARVLLYGDCYDEAYSKALEIQQETGAVFVHPFNDLQIATGQGSIAMEIIKELPTVDYILVPVGGGGLCTGVSTLAKLLNPKIKVIAVEPAGAACLKASLEAGEVVTLPEISTIADGTAVQTPGDKLFPYLQANVDEVLTIDDSELTFSFLDMAENHKMIVENSGLLTVSALKHLEFKNKKVVSVLSGGNMDVLTMATMVQNGLMQRDRIFTVSVMLPDKPGQLAAVSALIAKLQGNVIKLDHNVFANVNRAAGVQLTITMESFGTDHKNQIVQALKDAGYQTEVARTSRIYM